MILPQLVRQRRRAEDVFTHGVQLLVLQVLRVLLGLLGLLVRSNGAADVRNDRHASPFVFAAATRSPFVFAAATWLFRARPLAEREE